MNRPELDQKVREELEHIPRDPGNAAQIELRMIYNAYRRGQLSSDPSSPAADSLRHAIDWVRRSHPLAALNYEQQFFGV